MCPIFQLLEIGVPEKEERGERKKGIVAWECQIRGEKREGKKEGIVAWECQIRGEKREGKKELWQ